MDRISCCCGRWADSLPQLPSRLHEAVRSVAFSRRVPSALLKPERGGAGRRMGRRRGICLAGEGGHNLRLQIVLLKPPSLQKRLMWATGGGGEKHVVS